MRICFLVACLVFLNPCVSFANDTIYVNAQALGANNGHSWSNAYTNLQTALENVHYGDVIWIAEGTYTPPPPVNPYPGKAFRIPNGARLYGGFSGTETELQQRNYQLHKTVLTPNPTYPFLILYGLDSDTTTLVDGITFNNGSPAFGAGSIGGAIYLYSTTPDTAVFLNIVNCTFFNNKSERGGGIYLQSTGGKGGVCIKNCLFDSNFSSNAGGAVFIETGPGPQFPITIENNIFFNNRSYDTASAIGYGNSDTAASFTLKDCLFLKNKSSSCGAICFISNNKSKTTISDCIFDSNEGGTSSVTGGSGGASYGDRIIYLRCRFQGNRAFRGGAVGGINNEYLNCIFTKNVATLYGGAVGFLSSFAGLGGAVNKFVNCTFYGNYAADKGGVFNSYALMKDSIFNCIFQHNSAGNDGKIFFSQFGRENIYISNTLSDLSDCTEFVSSTNILGTDTITCNNNVLFQTDALFADTIMGNYSLKSCSPAINLGSLDALPAYARDFDFSGNSRILNQTPDAGAYEREPFYLSAYGTVSPETGLGISNGAISLDSILGNDPPFVASWSNGQIGPYNAGLAQGNYQVTISNAEGCDTSFHYTVDLVVNVASPNGFAGVIKAYPSAAMHNTPLTLDFTLEQAAEMIVETYDGNGRLLHRAINSQPQGASSLIVPAQQGIEFVLVKNHKGGVCFRGKLLRL